MGVYAGGVAAVGKEIAVGVAAMGETAVGQEAAGEHVLLWGSGLTRPEVESCFTELPSRSLAAAAGRADVSGRPYQVTSIGG